MYYLVLVFCVLFFFVKQKTAYEMRISDWSSDVCSSDLTAAPSRSPDPRLPPAVQSATADCRRDRRQDRFRRTRRGSPQTRRGQARSGRWLRWRAPSAAWSGGPASRPVHCIPRRTEERRVGEEGGSTWRAGGGGSYNKKNKNYREEK